jgi:hypothetical protein
MGQRKALREIESVGRMFNDEVLSGNEKLSGVSVRSRASSMLPSVASADEMEVEEIYNPLLVNGTKTHVKSGVYVHIEIRHVPAHVAESIQSSLQRGVSMFSLLPDENKLSVLHFNVQLIDGQNPIKSKEPMLFQVGFRTFAAKPIFSEANLNCDKHKMERFLQPGKYIVASIFAPITYLPCPMLMFSNKGQQPELVGTGSLFSIDPDRIILKKVFVRLCFVLHNYVCYSHTL